MYDAMLQALLVISEVCLLDCISLSHVTGKQLSMMLLFYSIQMIKVRLPEVFKTLNLLL